MSMKSLYEEYLARREAMKAHPMAYLWTEQERRYVKPFPMYGDLYYVGDSWVCGHLVDTGEGLLLFDAGNCGAGATAMLVQAIWEAGFRPNDVKWLVMSHGHVDHIGAANFFKRMFGTKLYLGAPDAEDFRTRPELSLIQESTDYMDELFVPDVEIQDGDVLDFGGTRVTFRLVPGHSNGVIACFFDVNGPEGVKRAGYFGGFGFNTLQKDYLLEIGDDSFQMRRTYLESLRKVRDERVDIFMPNHTNNVDVVAKRRLQLEDPEGPNPFVDSGAWRDYLDKTARALEALMADPAQN